MFSLVIFYLNYLKFDISMYFIIFVSSYDSLKTLLCYEGFYDFYYSPEMSF